MVKRWTVGLSHFLVGRRVLRVRPRAFPERNYKMLTIRNANLEGWNRNTELGCDVKTILRNDRHMKTGKAYQGVLTRDSDADIDEFLRLDAHFTFVETAPQTIKRNPRVFDGDFVTITRHDDGTLRPNLKPMKVDRQFSVDSYALAVCNELCMALEGLVEE